MRSFISLFTGLGGLDLGLECAGWHCLYATDIDAAAVASLNANRGARVGRGVRFLCSAQVERGDIRHLDGRKLLTTLGRRCGEVELLAGGPPCQSWSSAGHQLGFNDPRGQMLAEYLRLASELDTRFLLFENVRGLVTARGPDGRPGSALAWLREQLFAHGWQTKVELLNAADFGVPQRRIRVVLLGHRAGDEPTLPIPTHSKSPVGTNLLPWRSMKEALAAIASPSDDEVIRPSGKLAFDLADISPGSGVKSPGKAEATRPGGHWGYKQGAFVADMTLPARTVTANSQQDWIRDPKLGLRRLSPRECAALQTFPQDWKIEGKRVDQYRQIGNAVPPLLAQAVGQALLQSMDRRDTVTTTLALSPLPRHIQSAIDYTAREERRNGDSRRKAPVRRKSKVMA